jgi:cellulose synthase/poly-beta-1,6-N-acetylglucosamine synthase-like glycosyltransferase
MVIAVLFLVFLLCVAALLHTYVVYPMLVCAIARKKQVKMSVYEHNSPALPQVSILMAVYNEELVLPEKLANLAQIISSYPKISIFIGSDASTDQTNSLLEVFGKSHPSTVQVHLYQERRGKPPVINQLAVTALKCAPASEQHVFVMTDASVMLAPNTVFHLAKHFKDPQVGCVDAHMLTQHDHAGIAESETTYMQRETRLKQCESSAWGTMIGPFGGCYAIRTDLFSPIPPFSLVDDFYLGFGVLTQGYQALNELEALCYERPSSLISEEYRRKRRIATGSMKNLAIYRDYALKPWSQLGFAFVSHKVLRWFGPFFLILIWLTSLALMLITDHPIWFIICLGSLIGVVLVAFVYQIGHWTGHQVKIVRNLFYFLAMNIALFHGVLTYLRGVKTSIWTPTRRET